MTNNNDTAGPLPGPRNSFENVFRALRSRNYRLYFSSMFLSLLGTWISSIAMGWLAFRLSGSEKLLGLVTFGAHFPAVFITPLAAVLIDRLDTRGVLISTHAAFFLLSSTLFALVAAGRMTPELLLVFSVLQGVIAGVDMPARQVLIPQLVTDRKDLPNVIALNSAMFHSARMIGPAIGGGIVALSGEAACFFIDALSFLAPIAGLLAMTLAERKRGEQKKFHHDFLHGARYTFTHPVIVPLIVTTAIVGFIGPAPSTLMPAFVKEVFKKGPEVLGFLGAASGCGSLAASLLLATRRDANGLHRAVAFSALLLSIALCLFSQMTALLPAYLLLFTIGGCVAFNGAACNTIIQTVVDDAFRARAISFFFIVFMGSMPLGSLAVGIAAESVGVAHAVLGGGLLTFCLSLAVIVKNRSLAAARVET